MDLHDATLRGLVVSWPDGSVTARFRTASGEVVITARGLRHLDLPRDEPWGPSVSVNRVVQTAGRLTIEMQSGDVVTIDAETFSIG
jgi:hypothetical protein